MLRWTIGPRVKIICQHHADRPFDDFRKYIFRWADKYVDAYLFASRVQGEEWVKDRIYVVMGMSSIFYPEHRPKTGKVYLWVGDLDHNKDPLTAVKAFVKYSEKYPDVELNMIYQNDELLDDLKSIANKNIHFIGMVEHAKLQDWFNRSDFIISTSYYESAGIAVCEAMSCGCIPILTYIPSFAMMTGEWSVGRWFIPGDVDMLLDALEEPFDKDESQRVIDHFEKELSFEANARKIVEVINQL
jgi:glycosyltransferase involved in cell wall biosynthesis